MAKTIVVTNRKGGCGKSVTTASLGVGLARQGKKTLIIDTDNQHSLTVSGLSTHFCTKINFPNKHLHLQNQKRILRCYGL